MTRQAGACDAEGEGARRAFRPEAHHTAFAAVDGVDPDWAQWYAKHLKPEFDKALDAELSESEVVALLLSLAQEHAARGEGTLWPQFYAKLVHERFVAAEAEGLALYHAEYCPYCHMVRRVIDELGILVELRDVASATTRDELIAARGRGTVPVLRCESPDGVVRWLPESRDIIKFLRDRGGR